MTRTSAVSRVAGRPQRSAAAAVLALGTGLLPASMPTPPPTHASDFVHYVSAHVHPFALCDDGRHLFAVNTPEARLAVFRGGRRGGLELVREVPVGLEPVSLAVRPGTHEVWVVNHLSDSVSVVDAARGRVLDTLAVDDEPTDVAFARGNAYVSLSGREDALLVVDAATRAPVVQLEVFGDDPRALAVTPDERRVALVVLESGNATTTVHESRFTADRQPPPPLPARAPVFPPRIPPQPTPVEPLIVQRDAATGRWLDEAGADWSDQVFFGEDVTLPDHDVFVVDATLDPPAIVERIPGVGTTLFDVAVHPRTGAIWVPNTDARNAVRFEPNLRGHLVETRITQVEPGAGTPTHVDLNPHVDYSVTPGPPEEIAKSLAIPVAGRFDRHGRHYYLAAFGSAKVAVLDGRTGEVLRRIDVGGGPRRLYVMRRFSNTIAVVDPVRGRVVAETGAAVMPRI